jgi:WD40 repeat protein
VSYIQFSNTTVNTTATAHSAVVNALLQINTNQVATASNDGTIKVWNVDTSTLLYTFYGHSAAVQTLAILSDGLLASGSSDKTLIVWNLVNKTAILYNMTDPVSCIKLHPISTTRLLVNTPSNISIYNTASNMSQVATVAVSANSVIWLEVLKPSGNVLAVGSSTFCIYNFPSLTTNFTTGVFGGQILNRARQLPDNLTVVIGEWNGSLVLFNSQTNTFGASYLAHQDFIEVLELTPDNLVLISGSNNRMQFFMWTWTSMNLVQICGYSTVGQVYSAALISSGLNGRKINIKYF